MSIALIDRAQDHAARLAVVDDDGACTYGELLARSAAAASTLLDGTKDLAGARVAFLVPPGRCHVVTQWAIWRAGGVAVPLCAMHPAPELDYVLGDAAVDCVVAHPDHAAVLQPLAAARDIRFVSTAELCDAAPTDDAHAPRALPKVDASRDAMLIYTSGTTGKPKAAISTHAILSAQIRSVVEAWAWSPADRILHVLPLHHLHGILNLMCSALWAGATCEFMPRFDPERAWARIADAHELTLFMAVPTIYAKLTAVHDAASPARQAQMAAGCRRLRLMVCGSAALPVSTLERWREISGHTLLERYGMTEIGMCLGNPLDGERRPGHVGLPFPGVEVRLRAEDGTAPADGQPGEIQVRGPSVFKGYWQRPDATAEAFTDDGWFRTGDIALLDDGYYRILGRASVDILKTGGYKVSALEIEDALREHPAIAECAVVGVADPEWGQRVAAAVILRPGATLTLDALREWGKARLAAYKVPTLLRLVDALPRNPMGKVQKPAVSALFESP